MKSGPRLSGLNLSCRRGSYSVAERVEKGGGSDGGRLGRMSAARWWRGGGWQRPRRYGKAGVVGQRRGGGVANRRWLPEGDVDVESTSPVFHVKTRRFV